MSPEADLVGLGRLKDRSHPLWTAFFRIPCFYFKFHFEKKSRRVHKVLRLLASNEAQVFSKINMVVRGWWRGIHPALKGLFWDSHHACLVLWLP